MSIWSKMVTALRGGINEAGEAVVDSQALRILDQEVRDATEELRQSKEGLTAIVARQKLAEEELAKSKASLEEYEGYALKALEKGDETLALEIAGKISELELQIKDAQNSASEFAASADELRSSIRSAENGIKRLKQQIDTVKATESVQKAQAAVAERHSGSDSKLRTAMDSLERIKQRQDLKAAEMKAAKEIAETGEDSLQEKLEKAGIVEGEASAKDVLERLKARSQKA